MTGEDAQATSRDDPAPWTGDGDAGAIFLSLSVSSCGRFVTGEQARLSLIMARMKAWDHAGDDKALIARRVARRASLDATLGERWYAKAFSADAEVRSADPTLQARVMTTRERGRRRSSSTSPTTATETIHTAAGLAIEPTAAEVPPASPLWILFSPPVWWLTHRVLLRASRRQIPPSGSWLKRPTTTCFPVSGILAPTQTRAASAKSSSTLPPR